MLILLLLFYKYFKLLKMYHTLQLKYWSIMTLQMALTFKRIWKNNKIIKHKVKVITNLNICRSQGMARGESLCMDSLRMGRILGLYIGFKTFTVLSRYNIPFLLWKGHSWISCTLQISYPQLTIHSIYQNISFFQHQNGFNNSIINFVEF